VESWFPVFFQWFVLISAACLAALVCRSFILSLDASRTGARGVKLEGRGAGKGDGAALSTGGILPEYGRRPFYSVGQPVFWQIILLAALSAYLTIQAATCHD